MLKVSDDDECGEIAITASLEATEVANTNASATSTTGPLSSSRSSDLYTSPNRLKELSPSNAMDSFEIEEAEMMPLTTSENTTKFYSPSNLWQVCKRQRNIPSVPCSKEETNGGNDNGQNSPRIITRESTKQQFKGLLKLFSTLSRETNEYAPSGPIVASGGLDLFMPVLLNFHIFMILTHSDGLDGLEIPPQVQPLIFLSILMVRSFLPYGKRKRFWSTIYSAISALFHGVTFRDEVIGEVATSMVRPLQDIMFALFYYFASMYGIFSGSPELETTGFNLKHNFVLHNVVLPTIAVLPLVCRFMQTLRQAYDEQRRWPHLGNAFKYFTAGMVIFYGMTHSEEERSSWYIYCFGICLVYQIWWDIVIDWELLRIAPVDEVDTCFCTPFCGRIKMRSRRLFKKDKTYWRIIAFNTIFRFTWMLSFIPAYHLDWTGEIKHTLSMDLKAMVSFTVALTELVRRCCWVILRLELETIKITDDKYLVNSCSAVSSKVQYRCFAPKESSRSESTDIPSQQSSMKWAAYRLLVKRLFCLELFVYFGAFVSCGLLVAALV